MEIKHLKAGDHALLDKVAVDVFDHVIDEDRLVHFLADESHCLFVAVIEGQVVGQARGIIFRHPDRGDEFFLENLGVTPRCQRQGIATKLVKALLAHAKACGCEDFWVGTEADNANAIAFYKSLGLTAEPVALFAADL